MAVGGLDNLSDKPKPRIGEKILVEYEITYYDEDLGAYKAEAVSPDWFQSEDGRLMEKPKHWRN